MKVFVTGGAGFVGSSLLRELLAQNYEVYSFDDYSNGRREYVPDEVQAIKGDVTSWKLTQSIESIRPNFICHLAAEPYVPYSYENPERFLRTNVYGTINVLVASKLFKVERMIHVSTSEVYGSAQYEPIDEKHPINPHSTYGVTKSAADRLCYVWSKEHGLPVVIARPFNCYGPRETQPYIIPEIISQLFKSKTLHLGNLEAKRDFTYVGDTARAIVLLLHARLMMGSTVNIGSGKSYSVKEIAEKIAFEMDIPVYDIISEEKRMRPHDVNNLCCDSTFLHELTGWEPKVDFSKGLSETLDWYRVNRKWCYE